MMITVLLKRKRLLTAEMYHGTSLLVHNYNLRGIMVKLFPGQVDVVTFDIKKFGLELKKKIEARASSGWDVVKKRNASAGGDKGMVWVNLALKTRCKL
jgi:hypothetical protein